jgi:hypothetical protein
MPPNEAIQNSQIQSWAVQAGIEEPVPALEFAGAHGWLENAGSSPGTTKLTQAGWDVGNG